MGDIMPTAAHVVNKLVAQQPFLEEALSQDILSHAKVAIWMKPAVERELGKEVEEQSIVMALRRLRKGMQAKRTYLDTAYKGGR